MDDFETKPRSSSANADKLEAAIGNIGGGGGGGGSQQRFVQNPNRDRAALRNNNGRMNHYRHRNSHPTLTPSVDAAAAAAAATTTRPHSPSEGSDAGTGDEGEPTAASRRATAAGERNANGEIGE